MPLFTPDDFKNDWYGYLTNQVSHVALGTIFTWALTVFSLVMIGEFPYKIHLFLSLAGMYLLYELLFQGWQRWDTVEDWVFFSIYGAGGTVLSFTEYDKGTALAAFDVTAPMVIFPVICIHLWIGCLLRRSRNG